MSQQTAVPSAPQAPVSLASEINNQPQSVTVDTIAQAIDNKNVTTQPSIPVEVKAEAKRLKQLNLKVYGQEMVEDLPFELEDKPEIVEYLTKNLQMSKAAQRALEEKGNYEKGFTSFLENLKNNPASILKELGIDPTEFSAKHLEEEVKRQQLSPEERRALEAEEKLRQKETEYKNKELEYRQREFESKRQQIHDKLENQMIQALDKSNLPQTPYIADRIAKYMLLALNDSDGPVELTPEEVIPLVREDLKNELQQMIKGMNEETAEDFIGKDVFSKVRKKNIEKIKQTTTPATIKASIKEIGNTQKESVKPKEQPRIPMRNFFGGI